MTEHIPRDFIEQLLHRTDIVELIDSRITLRKKTGSNFFACCPFHQEKNPSFSVSQTKQFYYCFGCGAHGNAIDFLMQYERLAFPEAVEALAKQMGLEIPRKSSVSPKKVVNQSLYLLLEQVSEYYQGQLRLHKSATKVVEYLKQRGLSGIIAKEFLLGYAPPAWDGVLQAFTKEAQKLVEAGMLIKKAEGGFYDRFRDRIMFPIHDMRGRIVGFGGRIIDQGEPKYLNSPETTIFQKSHELYGLYQALKVNRKLTRIVVVEGYMDVIALFQHGITYAVATLGTATTASHLERLFRHVSEVIFCFDGDQAGRTAAWRALQVALPLMRDGIQMRFMFLPDMEDPDSLIRKEGQSGFEKRIAQASTLSEFFFQHLIKQTNLASTDGRARLVKLATDLLKELPAGVFQQMMLQELAKKARVDVAQIPLAATTTAREPVQSQNTARTPSALRLAMVLLVQQPSLVQYVTEGLPKLALNGYQLFAQLVEKARQNPHVTTAGLLEHWRDSKELKVLAKLSQWEHMIPEAGIQHEFVGAVSKLHKLGCEEAINNLLAKAAHTALSSEEKQQLTDLITSKNPLLSEQK